MGEISASTCTLTNRNVYAHLLNTAHDRSRFFPPFVGLHTDGGKTAPFLRNAKAYSKTPVYAIKDADETEALAHTHKCEGFVSCCCCLLSFALLLRSI